MTELLALAPYGVLLLGALLALFADKLRIGDRGATVLGGVLAFVAAALFALLGYEQPTPFGIQLLISSDTRLATLAISALTGLWLFWLSGRSKNRNREAVALALFSAMGANLMVQCYDFIVMVLAIELATMPAYVLIGYKRGNLKSLEGAVKYFLLSVLSSLIMLFGVTFIIGLSGSTSFSGMNFANGSMIELVAILLVLVGIFFKVSAAPFHYWAPDAYEGAATWIVAFVASVPKIAGFTLAIRLIISMLAASASPIPIEAVGTIMTIIILASMALGAFAALSQTDVRRLMGYSGVINAGYILMPLASLNPMIMQTGFNPLFTSVLFAVFYAIATMGVLLISAHEGPKISDLAGLSKRNPISAWALAIFALSLIGVPPLAGFFAKFYIFTASLANGQTWIVIAALIASVVSAFYYLRLVKAAFVDEPEAELERPEDIIEDELPAEGKYRHPILPAFSLTVLMASILILGIFSGQILSWVASL